MNASSVSIATPPNQVPQANAMQNGHLGLPMGQIPAGMMIPMPMPHMALPPHVQMGMSPVGLLRAPHMPGKLHSNADCFCADGMANDLLAYIAGVPGGFAPYGAPIGFPMMPPRFR